MGGYRSLSEIITNRISAVEIPSNEAEILHCELRCILRDYGSSAPDSWKSISKRMLNPNQPFALHQMMHYGCYKDYPFDTPPAWLLTRISRDSTKMLCVDFRSRLAF
ncbi:uncharacterized protein A4U43_UnF9200, partial [Asparagus officinalis]